MLDRLFRADNNGSSEVRRGESRSLHHHLLPVCTRAKNLLKSKGVAFDEIDVTDDDALRAKMIEQSGGRRSVPEIFINGKIVGGFDELKALNDAGKLDGLLAESAPA